MRRTPKMAGYMASMAERGLLGAAGFAARRNSRNIVFCRGARRTHFAQLDEVGLE